MLSILAVCAVGPAPLDLPSVEAHRIRPEEKALGALDSSETGYHVPRIGAGFEALAKPCMEARMVDNYKHLETLQRVFGR